MTRVRTLAVGLVAAAALGAGACSTADPAAGTAQLAVNGRALVDNRVVTGDTIVGRGAQVQVTSGTAVLTLGSGAAIELRRGTTVRLDAVPALLAGDALLLADDAPLDATVGVSTVHLDAGAARISRRLGITTATYSGLLTLESTGRRVSVPALRQASLPAPGLLPTRAQPLQIDHTDAWDRRYLGRAIELDEQLRSRSDGLSAQLPADAGRTPGFYRILLPALERESAFEAPLLDDRRSPGETLVGASIALAGARGTFTERWLGVFTFRDEGASWGLVATDQRVSQPAALTASLDAAIGRAGAFTVQALSPPPVVPAPPAAPPPSTVPPAQTPRPPSTAPISPPPPATAEPAAPAPEPQPGLLSPVTDLVGGLVGGLAGLLN